MNSLLKRAAETRGSLEKIYISNNNQISQRIIKIITVTNASIKAYCYRKRQFRFFNQANILSVAPIRNRRDALWIKDRGTKKWTAMMLPEHVTQLKEFYVEMEKVKKPMLDEQSWEQINETIHIATEYNLPVAFTLWRDGFFEEVEGVLHFIDEVNENVLVGDLKEDIHKINYGCIVDVRFAE